MRMSVDFAKEGFPASLTLGWIALWALWGGLPAPAHAQQAPMAQEAQSNPPDSLAKDSTGQQQQALGSIVGRVVDQSGYFVAGAIVRLSREGQPLSPEVVSDENGQFVFADVVPGPFQLSIASEGLASRDFSATLGPGEVYAVPQLTLTIATQVTEVRVGLTPVELADVQIKQQEQQRVLGFIPNFYVSYVPNAVPLVPKQKFELAWKSSTDPVTFAGIGALAGLDQALNRWGAYGPGIEGYAKRYGATYADVYIGTFMGGAILPSLLKQDPRYFYRGHGTKRSRVLYALASSVICKGDNGQRQPNYSSILGNLAAGGIANLYYPANDRNGAALVFSTALVRIGEMAVANVFQELLVPKLTPNLPTRAPSQP